MQGSIIASLRKTARSDSLDQNGKANTDNHKG